MKRFVEGEDRRQGVLLPEFLDDWVSEENPVRAIDVFVDALDLGALGFEGVEPAATGRPARYAHANHTSAPNSAAIASNNRRGCVGVPNSRMCCANTAKNGAHCSGPNATVTPSFCGRRTWLRTLAGSRPHRSRRPSPSASAPRVGGTIMITG